MTSLNVVQKLIEDIKIAAAANSLYLHRYQTNGGNHATRITYALHHSVERPMRSDQCSHWRVSISQNEGTTARCEAYRKLTKLMSVIAK